MVDTCPGSRKASTAQSGSASRARSAGGTSLWNESTQKFFSPCSRAMSTVAATVGAVVSNPMPRKTTVSPGLSAASFSASWAE